MTDTAAPPSPRLWRRPPLRNTLGEVVEVVDDDQGAPRATAPGRLVVVSGQTIASAWGNTTYDQTCQVFANAGDRDNQWPAPNDGAQCWLADSGTPWQWRAGAWHGIPLGYVGSVLGPSANVDCINTVVVSVTFTAAAGRRYRYSGYILGTQQTATSISRATFGGGGLSFSPYLFYGTYASGIAVAGSGFAHGVPGAGQITVNITGAASAGAFRVGANNCSLLVEDIGS